MKMKTFCLALTLLFVTTGGWGEEGSMVVTFPEKQLVWGTEVQKGHQLVWRFGITDTTREGLTITPYAGTGIALKKQLKQESNLGILKYYLAQVGGKWFGYEKKSQTTVARYSLKKVPTITLEAKVLEGRLGPLASSQTRVVQVQLATTAEKFTDLRDQWQGEEVFNPRLVDGRALYLVGDDPSKGMKITLDPRFGFEADNPLIREEQDLGIVRPTLVAWLMQSTEPPAIPGANVLFDKLPPIANNQLQTTESLNLRDAILSLVVHQLRMTESEGSATWDFPSSSLYRSDFANDYDRLFFQYLYDHKLLTGQNDLWQAGSFVDGASFSGRALEFLVGVEAGTVEQPTIPPAVAAEKQNFYQTGPEPKQPFNPRTSLGRPFGPEAINAGYDPGYVAEYRYLFQGTAAENFFANALPVVAPGKNLLTQQNLSNYAMTSALLQPVGNLTGVITAPFRFIKSQTLRSLLFWVKAGNTTPKFTIKTANGGNLQDRIAQASIQFWEKKPAGQGYRLEQAVSPTGKNLLVAVTWNQEYQADQIQIDFEVPAAQAARSSLLNVRAYAEELQLYFQSPWTVEDDSKTITLKYVNSPETPELYAGESSKNDGRYFVEAGGVLRFASLARDLPPFFSPAHYLTGGMETPLTHALKVLNNQEWKTAYGLGPSRFALTEFDLDRALSVTNSLEYAAGAAMPNLNPGLPAKDNWIYPYAFGVNSGNSAGVVTAGNSPLTAGKLTGVDSTGMVASILKTLSIGTRTKPEIQNTFDSRVNLRTYSQMKATSLQNAAAGPTLDSAWFLNNSVVVPQIESVQPGDLLVGYEGSDLSAAIVTNTPAFSQDDTTIEKKMHRVEVVTIYRSLQRAMYTRWDEMSRNPQNYHIRRLVKQGAGDVDPPIRTGFLRFPNPLTFSWEGKADPDGFGNWLPNTEELLSLGEVRLKSSDKNISIALANDKTWTINKAWDYNASQVQAGGNVTVNTDQSIFHLMALSSSRSENGISVVRKSNGGRKLEINEAIAVATFTRRPDGGYQVAMHLTPETLTVVDGKLHVAVGARNLSHFGMVVENPRPGDDLGLQFAVKTVHGTWMTDETTAPRLAVYDKKTLWRANLYLDETKPDAGNGTDWNDLHPWIGELNSDGSIDFNGRNYNEWNRYQDGITDFIGLENLTPVTPEFAKTKGLTAGGQVVKLSPFTPARNLPKGSPLIGTVAYSYPEHSFENGGGGWLGASGSMDSPFDFNKKMIRQKLLQEAKDWKLWVSDAGYRFKQPRNLWPPKPLNGREIDRFSSVADFDTFVGLPVGTSIAMVLTATSGGNWKDYAKPPSTRKLSDISLVPPRDEAPYSSKAPGNSWWLYSDWIPTPWPTGTGPNAFVPSLGLTYKTMYSATKYLANSNEPIPSGIRDQGKDFLQSVYVLEAGTDCIGFVQRAVSWKGRSYTGYTDINKGWTEYDNGKGTDNIWDQLNSYVHATGQGGRAYPRNSASIVNNDINQSPGYEDSSGYFDTSKSRIDKMTELEKAALVAQLKLVVPGDIWVKESKTFQGEWSAHIAIVASVPTDPAIADPLAYMDGMILVEGEFNYKIQSVIKKLSVGDYNNDKPRKAKQIYPGFRIAANQVDFSLNTKSWAIRRLK